MTAHTTKKRASETAAGGRSLGHWCSMSSASSPAASLASIRRHSGQSGPSHRVRCQRSVLVIRTVIGPRSRLAERSRWRPSLRRVGRALAAIAATCRACAGVSTVLTIAGRSRRTSRNCTPRDRIGPHGRRSRSGVRSCRQRAVVDLAPIVG